MSQNNNNNQAQNENISLKANIPMGVFTAVLQLLGGAYFGVTSNDNIQKVVERIDALSNKVQILTIKQDQYDPKLANLEAAMRKLEDRTSILENRVQK